MAGFEPAASTSQTWRDNRATLHPEGYLFFTGDHFLEQIQKGNQQISDRDRIRTCDRLLRRQMLYPAELRDPVTQVAERKGFEPPVPAMGTTP